MGCGASSGAGVSPYADGFGYSRSSVVNPASTSTSADPGRRRSTNAEFSDDVWECSEEEALLLGLPTDWSAVLSALNKTISNRRELRDLLCSFNCDAESAETVLDTLTEEMSLAEQNHFFGEVLQAIIHWAKELPLCVRSFSCSPAEPRGLALLAGAERSVTFSRTHLRCVLSAAFLCLFQSPRDARFSAVNFEPLFRNSRAPQERAKLMAIMQYFKRVCKERPTGSITFKRAVLRHPPSFGPGVAIPPCEVVEEGSIIDAGPECAKAVLACRVLGGGVLTGGSWQEEAVFASYPEMIAGCLFVESLDDTEALIVSGAERYTRLKGFAFHMSLVGDVVDPTPKDPATGTLRSHFLIMDAKDYRNTGRLSQFLVPSMQRDLGKALCTFRERPELRVATGSWGTGNHLGDPTLKFVLQLLAASVANCKGVQFFNFGDPEFSERLRQLVELMRTRKVSAAGLWQALAQYSLVVGGIMSEREAILTQFAKTHPPSPSPEFYEAAGLKRPEDPPELLSWLTETLQAAPASTRKETARK